MFDPVRSAAPSTGPTDPLAFSNPVLRGFNPDPTICVVPASGDTPTTYFLSTSTFEYFPGCAIYTSTDLLNWKLIGHALNRRSQIELRTVEPGAGSWASTLRYRAGEKRWYLANCLFQRYRPATDVIHAFHASSGAMGLAAGSWLLTFRCIVGAYLSSRVLCVHRQHLGRQRLV